MLGRRLIGLVSLTLLLAAVPAHATDRFVSTAGLDANPCTALQPCLTVQEGLDAAATSGDRVVVGAGTFTGHATTAKQVDVVGAGSSGAGATILAGDDANATLQLQGGGSVAGVLVRAGTGGGLLLTSTTAAAPALSYAVSGARIEGAQPGCGVVCLAAALFIGPAGSVPTRSVTATVDHVDVTTGAGFGIDANAAGASATLRNVSVAASHASAQSIVFANGADGSVADSSISGTGNGFDLTGSGSDQAEVTIARVRVDVSGEAFFNVISRATVSDSLLISRGGAGAVVQGIGTGPGTDLVLRGSTLYAEGTSGTRALQLFQSAGTAAPTAELTNSIVRAVQGSGGAAAADIEAHGASALLTAAHSAFTTTLLTGGAPASAIPAVGSGTNLSGDPGLLAPAPPTADFHLAVSSPLIDRGDPAIVAAGETDLGGAVRSLDGNGDCTSVPDIGAFEAPAKATSGCSSAGDHTPPKLSGVAFSPATFRAATPPRGHGRAGHRGRARGHAARTGRRRHAPRAHRRGSRLNATVTEAGRLEVALVRCTNRRCTRTKAAGTLRFAVKVGRNSLSFPGRVGRKALRVGRYRASVRAIDAAGNASSALQASFAIVAR